MTEKYLEDLQEIKAIMDRSSRVISLSGYSGVATGIIAIAGAWAAHYFVLGTYELSSLSPVEPTFNDILILLLIAFLTLATATFTAIYLTRKKNRREQESTWRLQSKRLLSALLIPLVSGGLLCLIFLFNGFLSILPGLTLMFYGLALVNAGKFTQTEIRGLGIAEIVAGLLAIVFINYGLLFWTLGFGILHIVYGIMVQWKHKE